jgi:hypothetical protein
MQKPPEMPMTRPNLNEDEKLEEALRRAEKKLEAEFYRRIETLRSPETRARIKAVMDARGRSKVRLRAGDSFQDHWSAMCSKLA